MAYHYLSHACTHFIHSRCKKEDIIIISIIKKENKEKRESIPSCGNHMYKMSGTHTTSKVNMVQRKVNMVQKVNLVQ